MSGQYAWSIFICHFPQHPCLLWICLFKGNLKLKPLCMLALRYMHLYVWGRCMSWVELWLLRICKSYCRWLSLAVGSKSSFLYPYLTWKMFTLVMSLVCLINLAKLPSERSSYFTFFSYRKKHWKLLADFWCCLLGWSRMFMKKCLTKIKLLLQFLFKSCLVIHIFQG